MADGHHDTPHAAETGGGGGGAGAIGSVIGFVEQLDILQNIRNLLFSETIVGL